MTTALVFAVTACVPDSQRSSAGAAGVTVGLPVPEYNTLSLAGDSVSLVGLRGKVVLLNIWATWCHPCRDEIPELRGLDERYRQRGLEVVGVSVDADGADAEIRAFTIEFAMKYPIWLDPSERISTQFLVIGVPTTFVIDRQGVLRWRKTGPIQGRDSTLTAVLEEALRGDG